jgi:hypothetical protein
MSRFNCLTTERGISRVQMEFSLERWRSDAVGAALSRITEAASSALLHAERAG